MGTADPARLHLYTIPPHRAFADALAAGLIRRFGAEPMGLARGVVLVPTNRAKKAMTDAFVRASGGGLLLPRMVAIGDPAFDEAAGPFLDPADDADPIPPAVSPLQRRMILARLVAEERRDVDAAEAVRLAGELARTLDQLLVEEIAPHRLGQIEMAEPLQAHWQRSLDLFGVLLDRWPRELAAMGRIDLAERRGRVLDRVATRWREVPPPGFVCASGVTDSAPSVARLLRVVAGLAKGMVVFPGLDTAMAPETWAALGPHKPDPVTGRVKRAVETHPQFHLKLLMERMGVGRGEVTAWRGSSELDAPPARSKAIANALAPADHTHGWSTLPAAERRLSGVEALEAATPADEAQAIAIAMRHALETSERTAALVTPDRALAQRVAAHLARWGVVVDDSAGQPLSMTPPGTLLLALAEAAAQDFAPLALLALVKHPLAMAGEGRGEWLEGARALDLALRGPRPAPGLSGIDRHLAEGDARTARVRAEAAAWWPRARALLEPIAAAFAKGAQPPATLVTCLREAATALGGDMLWSRASGREAAALIDSLEQEAPHGPPLVAPDALGPMLRTLMDEVAVRPPQGGHPRLAIYGLIEARLQAADLMILGGLNEGVWPGLPAPDPWLAPRIRSELGLPGLDRRIGIAAHDLAGALGAPQVLLTRARRDASAPTIASRFWLRLEALASSLDRAEGLAHWARTLDDPGDYAPADRPAPAPPANIRPRAISVTEVDRLKADPFAFYARRMLRLMPLDPVDADPSAAWRGTEVHRILERWKREDDCAPDALRARALAMMADARTHPMLRALWQPRLMEAIDWIAAQTVRLAEEGRHVLDVEGRGVLAIAGVDLSGTYDRIDRAGNGSLVVIDYKTGKPPSNKAVAQGYSMQLGMLGLIAESGGFAGIAGSVSGFEYWSLARGKSGFGAVASPVHPDGAGKRIVTADFVDLARDQFVTAVETWLTGEEPFRAKLHPEYAPYAEYDQLMRLDEWYGRG